MRTRLTNTRSRLFRVIVFGMMLVAVNDADAQSRRPRPRSRNVQIGGYVMFGAIGFTAADSFDAILGRTSAPILGGGVTVGLPLGGLFVNLGGWRFKDDGERVLVVDREVFPLGIPVSITLAPVELSAGWRFRLRRRPSLIPYVAAGLTSYGYKETSRFASAGEDIDDRFNGYHLLGGVEVKLRRWLGVAGEANWTTVPDAIGAGGASKAFGDTDLGGNSFRVKVTIGR